MEFLINSGQNLGNIEAAFFRLLLIDLWYPKIKLRYFFRRKNHRILLLFKKQALCNPGCVVRFPNAMKP